MKNSYSKPNQIQKNNKNFKIIKIEASLKFL